MCRLWLENMSWVRSQVVAAQAYACATATAPAHVLLEHVHQVQASLLVMRAYGRSTLRELFGGPMACTMLRESLGPLFLYH